MSKIIPLLLLFVILQCSKNSVRENLPVDYVLIHHKIQIDSLEREYILFQPKQIKAEVILIALHGRGGTGEELMWKTGFNSLAEEEGFIIVYPFGLNRAWVDGRQLPDEDKNANDEKFILTLREKLKKEFSIQKFFLFGYSNGGFMAQRMAFFYPNTFIGYAGVVSSISENLNKHKPRQPAAVLFINGTDDPIVPYNGGMILGNKGVALGVEDTVKQWIKWNKCELKPELETINQQDDGVKVFIYNYTKCKSKKSVRFIKLEGAGHGWPGKLEEEISGFGKFTTEVSANQEIWKFAKSQLPRKN